VAGQHRWGSNVTVVVVLVVAVVHVHVHVVAADPQTANKPQSPTSAHFPLPFQLNTCNCSCASSCASFCASSCSSSSCCRFLCPLMASFGQGQHVERIASSYVCVTATVDWLLFLVRELSAGTVEICISKTYKEREREKEGHCRTIVCADCYNSRPKVQVPVPFPISGLLYEFMNII